MSPARSLVFRSRAPHLIKSETHPYKGYVIEAESVPVDDGWTFAATVTRNGRVVKSIAASGQVVFKTPEHAADVAVFLSRAWVDRAGRAELDAPAALPASVRWTTPRPRHAA